MANYPKRVVEGKSAPRTDEIWLDTNSNPPVFKSFINGQWVSVAGSPSSDDDGESGSGGGGGGGHSEYLELLNQMATIISGTDGFDFDSSDWVTSAEEDPFDDSWLNDGDSILGDRENADYYLWGGYYDEDNERWVNQICFVTEMELSVLRALCGVSPSSSDYTDYLKEVTCFPCPDCLIASKSGNQNFFYTNSFSNYGSKIGGVLLGMTAEHLDTYFPNISLEDFETPKAKITIEEGYTGGFPFADYHEFDRTETNYDFDYKSYLSGAYTTQKIYNLTDTLTLVYFNVDNGAGRTNSQFITLYVHES